MQNQEEDLVTVSAEEARAHLSALIKQVNEDRAAIRITSDAGDVILVAERDYNAWQETAYLMSFPANAERIEAAYRRAVEG